MGDFGGKLRQAREHRGVSLRQISAATKISIGVLQALERNDVSKLPGGIFSRAFVRSYAVEVGLDPDETIRDFIAEFPAEGTGMHAPAPSSAIAAPAPRVTPEPPRRTLPVAEVAPDESEFESRQRMANVVLQLVVASGLVIVAGVLYVNMRGEAPAPEVGPPSRPAPELLPPPAADPVPSPAGAATAGRQTAAARPPQSPSVPVGTPDHQTIEIQPGATCLVSLAVDGGPSLTREMQAGERELRTFREEAVLKVSDGAACEFALNGRLAKPLGGPGEARTIKITPQNLASYLP